MALPLPVHGLHIRFGKNAGLTHVAVRHRYAAGQDKSPDSPRRQPDLFVNPELVGRLKSQAEGFIQFVKRFK